MEDVSSGMKVQVLLSNPVGAHIKLVITVKAQVDYLDKDPRDK